VRRERRRTVTKTVRPSRVTERSKGLRNAGVPPITVRFCVTVNTAGPPSASTLPNHTQNTVSATLPAAP
jgi:hypothetical protein